MAMLTPPPLVHILGRCHSQGSSSPWYVLWIQDLMKETPSSYGPIAPLLFSLNMKLLSRENTPLQSQTSFSPRSAIIHQVGFQSTSSRLNLFIPTVNSSRNLSTGVWARLGPVPRMKARTLYASTLIFSCTRHVPGSVPASSSEANTELPAAKAPSTIVSA